MATFKQTEINAIEYVGANGAGTIVGMTAESEMLEISDDELEAISGGAMHASTANFDRHRVAMSGQNFAGPDGAGSSFSMKEEDVHSSSSDFMSDD
jgi:bacteriocin-like protein